MPAPIRNIQEYYEQHIIRLPIAGCWLWTGPMNDEYGAIKSKASCELYAHRFAWRLFNGPIPQGSCVLHKCDTPLCTNPYHLFLGTRAENNQDREKKKRGGNHRGELNGRAILTKEQVFAIRKDKRKIAVIAREYKVKWTAIADIRTGRSWRHF